MSFEPIANIIDREAQDNVIISVYAISGMFQFTKNCKFKTSDWINLYYDKNSYQLLFVNNGDSNQRFSRAYKTNERAAKATISLSKAFSYLPFDKNNDKKCYIAKELSNDEIANVFGVNLINCVGYSIDINNPIPASNVKSRRSVKKKITQDV